jgi:cysteine desulfurase
VLQVAEKSALFIGSKNGENMESEIIKTKVYLDHNATTPLAEEVVSGLPLVSRIWGNPSSIHYAGRGPKAILRETRSILSAALHVNPLEIVFTSGGSESNNSVIKGIFDLIQRAEEGSRLFLRTEFITSEVEHPSVLKTFKWIETRGATVHYLKVNRNGDIDLQQYEKVLSERTALVSIMYANNETGTIFPIQKMVKLAHAKGALFHSDCVQALGKMSLNLDKLELDYASFSAHKFYAMKGLGLLYIRKGSPYEPLLIGGAQERNRRGGTENVLGIWSLGEVARKLSNISEIYPQIQELRDNFETRILDEITDIEITARQNPRLPNTSSLIIKNVDGETLLMNLDLLGFAVSTGAACSSGNPEPSPVLLAMGLSKEEAQSSLRVSLGLNTTSIEIDKFIKTLKIVVSRLRSLPKMTEGLKDVELI